MDNMTQLFVEMCSCFKRHKGSADFSITKSQYARSKCINKQLKMERRRYLSKHHILLLGTGESGKSTFLKQMKIICGKKFTQMEMDSFKDTIYDNIFKGILFLIDTRQQLGIAWKDEMSGECAQRVEDYYVEMKSQFKERRLLNKPMWSEEDFLKIVCDIKSLWTDNSIKESFNRRNEIMTESFSENTRFYLNKIELIGVTNYIPTNEDIVWTRKPTESIIEEELEMHDKSLLVFIDVGGQTKERRKWCQFFQDMNSVLFLVACSHFDEEYVDRHTDQKRNKLTESLIIFEELINQDSFLRASVLLFFNKTDLLIEKISQHHADIRRDFPHFPDNLDPFKVPDVQTFLVDSFTRLIDNPPCNDRIAVVSRTASLINRNNNIGGPISRTPVPPRRTIYRHFTTAVDKDNIERVFNAMKDTVLHNNIRKLMMN